MRIGTRGSDLALVQARAVAASLREHHPDLACEVVPIKTRADRMQEVAIAELGGKGVFVKEIETELLKGTIDLAVHSMKDVPAELPEGLEIAAYPRREDPRDILVTRGNVRLEDLPPGARIGTGSLRRRMQLLKVRPDLKILPIRGNLRTRIDKIEGQGLEGIVLAAAGMARMGWLPEVSQFLSPDLILPAAGQGVLGIEIRRDDRTIKELVSCLNHTETVLEILAERAYLGRLGGGCQVPIAGYARVHGASLQISGLVGTPDGLVLIGETFRGDRHDGAALGRAVADSILARGGLEVLDLEYGSC